MNFFKVCQSITIETSLHDKIKQHGIVNILRDLTNSFNIKDSYKGLDFSIPHPDYQDTPIEVRPLIGLYMFIYILLTTDRNLVFSFNDLHDMFLNHSYLHDVDRHWTQDNFFSTNEPANTSASVYMDHIVGCLAYMKDLVQKYVNDPDYTPGQPNQFATDLMDYADSVRREGQPPIIRE